MLQYRSEPIFRARHHARASWRLGPSAIIVIVSGVVALSLCMPVVGRLAMRATLPLVI